MSHEYKPGDAVWYRPSEFLGWYPAVVEAPYEFPDGCVGVDLIGPPENPDSVLASRRLGDLRPRDPTKDGADRPE